MGKVLRRAALFAAVAAAVLVVPGSHVARPSLTSNPVFCQRACLMFGLAGSMSVPAMRASVTGTIGGSFDALDSNPARAVTGSGVVNGVPVRVVASTWSWKSVSASGRASAVYAVSGLNYRYADFSASIGYYDVYAIGSPQPPVTVISRLKTYPRCTRHGLTRDPVRDCLPGTQTYVSGTFDLTNVSWTPGTVASFTAPLTGLRRPIDSRSRPLANWTSLGKGHWTVRAALDPNQISWLWSTEWNLAGIGSGWQAGATYIPNWRTNPRTVAFRSGPYA